MSHLTAFALWYAIGLQTFGALFTVAAIGKDRKPITPGDAIMALLFAGCAIILFIVVLIKG